MSHSIPIIGVFGAILATSLGALGCASTPPPRDLQDAREAYRLAATSPGAVRAQGEVDEAKKSLDQAEASFQDDADSQATHDWSYIAARKAGSARAKANALTIAAEGSANKQELKQLQAMQQSQNASELAAARDDASSERSARVAAEQKTNDALAKIAGMKSEMSERGLVLTLSGSVLFASGKSDLLPAAQQRLTDVANAIAEDGRSVTIMGFTDSTGSDELNDRLSAKRAEAVSAFLVTHGVPQGRVHAEGKGEANPIADNATAEGRANNRRVEILLENGTKERKP